MSDYSPRNILITGGAGFIGSNFIYHILKDNVNIVNIDCMSYCSTDMSEETVNRWIKIYI